METTSAGGPAAAAPEPSAEELAGLFEDLRLVNQLMARAVRRAGALAGSGVCEEVEGGSLDWTLTMVCRWSGTDARVLVGAGEVLRNMPTVEHLFDEGALSWSQVRRIVGSARGLRVAQRAVLDARVAAAVEEYGGVDAFDPDHLADAVDAAADELRSARSVERREEQAERANTLQLQPGLDGGVYGWFRFDALTGAMVLNGLDAAADRPAGCGSESAKSDDDEMPVGETRRGRQYADALVRLARNYLGGPQRHQARPLATVHFGPDDLKPGGSGVVELNLRGGLRRVSSKVLQALIAEADFRAVIFDGAVPLAVSRKIYAESIPSDVRFAIRARDLGCRFPGSRDPVGHCDVHHLRHREHGGTNATWNLAMLSRRKHVVAHKHGWRLVLDETTGAITAHRGRRAWRSLPRGTGLPPPRSPGDRRAGRPSAGAGPDRSPPRLASDQGSQADPRAGPGPDEPPLPF